jgi:hypothetical protein
VSTRLLLLMSIALIVGVSGSGEEHNSESTKNNKSSNQIGPKGI